MREMDALAGCCALVLLALHCVVTGCSAVNLEGSALLKFKSRVEEDPHGAMSGWSPRDYDPCSWNGVRCCTDGRVVMLNLKDLSLRGTMGPELGGLSHLQALVLSNNLFGGVIPKEIGGLATLEVLDLSNNNLNGEVPQEIAEMPSLKHLLLSNNRFQWPVIQNPYGNFDQEIDFDIYDHLGRVDANQRADTGFKSGSSTEENKIDTINLAARLPTQFATRNPAAQLRRRRLLQDINLAAAPSPNPPIPAVVPVPSTGSGSFSALSPIKAPAPAINPQISPPKSSDTPSEAGSKGRSIKWLYAIVIPSVALLLVVIACMLLLCRHKTVATIGPWKTGLSGQLQKAFVTGVPKLQRSELEGACEDFSNIVATYPHYTVYKGTLSSGVEIAVVSTVLASSKDWSKHSEGRFRKKIDSLSRINHKNFINLLGYCEEEYPFMRMMVLEYAPNGTLYEHLHVEGFDPIDWNGRMRVIMGVAYCIQHMHELNPSVTHPDLLSSAILLSEDGAAKIADMSVWQDVIAKEKMPKNDDIIEHNDPIPADPAGNVCSFGLLMLEIISGKPPYCEHKGSLMNMAMECIKDDRSISCLLDPTLKTHKENDLEVICELIQDCIQSDPKKRPSMREVVTKLREVIAISPEAATPRLSPLWWAELEILSVEAT
uniref:Uncharacterized protein n=2 Tax=Avena sativa TaxID=4498 RepID=A0ACD5VJL9_AVESA